ncbi:hypothetical protein H106_05298 [Trichophyton rubrum CBS 735.88]|nr:hypothetical protein H106_05298 [Trichophyton rubrum CBS 735.88]
MRRLYIHQAAAKAGADSRRDVERHQIIPLERCSLRSSHTFLPEHEHTIFSLSQTPALRATTPTMVSSSSMLKGPSRCLDTTMLRPIISHTAIGRSRKTLPLPFSSTSTLPTTPRGSLPLLLLLPCCCFSLRSLTTSQTPPVDSGPRETSPVSRIVAQYRPGESPLIVRSNIVRPLETCTMRTRPRILFATLSLCVSRIHTEASFLLPPVSISCDLYLATFVDVLFDVPLPRRMASRPVLWIAATMAEGAAVPSTTIN